MKKQFKYFFLFLLFVCCMLLGFSDSKALEISPRAIRYDFNASLSIINGIYQKVEYPFDDTGSFLTKFRYIRVRLEKGSGYGDKIDVSAIGGIAGEKVVLGKLQTLDFSGGREYIIDFKAPNAPERSDADFTINCSQPDAYPGILTDQNYCIANPTAVYGVQFENHSLFGGTAKVVGAFSFEN